MGDFNKYVIATDIDDFSQYPLSGPPPKAGGGRDPHGKVDPEWAGRWVANRAINLGWTPERFADFERNLNVSIRKWCDGVLASASAVGCDTQVRSA
jgi:hypothetical protein